MDKNNDQQSKDYLLALRHSTEHVLTQAMLKLYPKIKMAMGPATSEGFYFDFDSKIKISEEDFPKIEAEMHKIIEKNLPIIKDEMTVAEARKFLQSYNSSPAHAVGAVTVTNSATGKRASGMQKSTIYFKPLPDDFTEDFIKSGKAFKYAGGFPVQDSTWTPYIERIEGGWDTAAGLSKELLADLVKKVV